VLRTTDLLGRTGGDEFAVILELTEPRAALAVIARLGESVVDHHRASIGFAFWDGSEDVHALIARADADMYHRKRTQATAG
jgi:diguanylate cyclase (GGDEF)-like protein